MQNIVGKQTRRFWMGLSIIIIILYHLIFFSRDQVEFPHWMKLFVASPVSNGWLGVDIFFFLSAFGLCFSYEKNNLRTFYKNRVKRILPIYLIFAVVVTVLFMNEESGGDILIKWLKQISGLIILKPFGNSNSIEWFTPALILIYICFPLLFIATKHLIKKPTVLYLFIMLLVIGVNFLINIIFPMNFATRIPVIIVGICTYFFIKKGDERKMVELFTVMAILSFITTHWMMQFCLCIPLVLYGLNHIKIPDTKITKFISFIGSYSFEVYLAQVITTAYILAGDGDYFHKLALCIILTPIIAYSFILASKGISKIKIPASWKA